MGLRSRQALHYHYHEHGMLRTLLIRWQNAQSPRSAVRPSTTSTSVPNASRARSRTTARPRRTASKNVRLPLLYFTLPYLSSTSRTNNVYSLPPRPLCNAMRRPQALRSAQVNHPIALGNGNSCLGETIATSHTGSADAKARKTILDRCKYRTACLEYTVLFPLNLAKTCFYRRIKTSVVIIIWCSIQAGPRSVLSYAK